MDKSFFQSALKLPYFCFVWSRGGHSISFPDYPFIGFNHLNNGLLDIDNIIEQYEDKNFFRRVYTISLHTSCQTPLTKQSPVSFWVFYNQLGRAILTVLVLETKSGQIMIEFRKKNHRSFEVGELVPATEFPQDNFTDISQMEIFIQLDDNGNVKSMLSAFSKDHKMTSYTLSHSTVRFGFRKYLQIFLKGGIANLYESKRATARVNKQIL